MMPISDNSRELQSNLRTSWPRWRPHHHRTCKACNRRGYPSRQASMVVGYGGFDYKRYHRRSGSGDADRHGEAVVDGIDTDVNVNVFTTTDATTTDANEREERERVERSRLGSGAEDQ